jgi:hypothetical protein
MRVAVTLAVLSLMVLVVVSQSNCKGKVGNLDYDLTPLIVKTGGKVLSVEDT